MVAYEEQHDNYEDRVMVTSSGTTLNMHHSPLLPIDDDYRHFGSFNLRFPDFPLDNLHLTPLGLPTSMRRRALSMFIEHCGTTWLSDLVDILITCHGHLWLTKLLPIVLLIDGTVASQFNHLPVEPLNLTLEKFNGRRTC